MTEAAKPAVLLTIQTAGWEVIVREAENRIRAVTETALLAGTEAEALEWYRKAWAARTILTEFLRVFEPTKPLLDDSISNNEAEF